MKAFTTTLLGTFLDSSELSSEFLLTTQFPSCSVYFLSVVGVFRRKRQTDASNAPPVAACI
jgi:hypothetical protein